MGALRQAAARDGALVGQQVHRVDVLVINVDLRIAQVLPQPPAAVRIVFERIADGLGVAVEFIEVRVARRAVQRQVRDLGIRVQVRPPALGRAALLGIRPQHAGRPWTHPCARRSCGP
ncbi:hypothetical protein G6F53_013979 [Rhizopus delemar]|nr:hypothetical protein G6F53_013979 [Rhizopus delemar]